MNRQPHIDFVGPSTGANAHTIFPGASAGAKPFSDAEFSALAEEASRHRLLYIQRGAVVAVTTLVSIGAAFLIHALFAGVVILGFYLGPAKPHKAAGAGGDAPTEGGRGYMMTEDVALAPAPLEIKSALAALQSQQVSAVLPPAVMPAAPEPANPSVTAIAPPENVPPPSLPPLPMPDDFGRPVVSAPAMVTRPQTAMNGAVASVNPGSATSAARGDPRADPDYSNEPVAWDIRSDNGGRGSGIGRGGGTGNGIGIDRGPSGADTPEPRILEFAHLPQPNWSTPQTHIVSFTVLVLADGSVGSIQMTESSGRADIDAYYRQMLLESHFYPRIKGGKPVAESGEFSFNGSMK